MYKKYVSVLFFKVGDWKPLPKIAFVVLAKAQATQTMHSSRTMGNSSTFKLDIYCVYLCMDTKRKILVCKSKKKKEALKLGEGAAEYLNVKFANYTKK